MSEGEWRFLYGALCIAVMLVMVALRLSVRRLDDKINRLDAKLAEHLALDDRYEGKEKK